MVYLTLEDIFRIRDQISTAHPEQLEVLTFNGLLSALAAPQRSAFGVELFADLSEKAGALVYGLIQNHPFWDGNKRIATAALRLFLCKNGAYLAAADWEVRFLTTSIACGDMRDAAIAEWLTRHIAYANGMGGQGNLRSH